MATFSAGETIPKKESSGDCILCGKTMEGIHIEGVSESEHDYWPLLDRGAKAHLDCYIHHAIDTAISNHIYEEEE